MNNKILIFGASTLGKLAYYFLENSNNIIGFIDNDIKKQGENFLSVPIMSLAEAKNHIGTQIVVASEYKVEITAQLVREGVKNYTLFNAGLKNENISKNFELLNLGELLVSTPEALDLNNLTFAAGGSGILDYAFLCALMIRLKLKFYLEIGTYRGESIANISRYADKCYSISLPDDAISHLDSSGQGFPNSGFSRYFSKPIANIKHFYENSTSFDFSSIIDPLDIVFIDGDHSFNGILADTTNIFNFIDLEHTIVVWHDFKSKDNKFDTLAVSAISQALSPQILECVFGVDNSLCGVYLPTKYHHNFAFGLSKNQMFTYNVNMQIKKANCKASTS